MNYKWHYDSLIEKAKKAKRERGDGNYYESHHIIPRSEGGLDEPDNLVLLTGREHFVAHWLLFRDDPTSRSRTFSFLAMTSSKIKRNFTPSSRAIQEAKQASSVAHREKMLGSKRTEETKQKIRTYRTGRKHTEESKAKMSESHMGLRHTEESRARMKVQRKEEYRTGVRKSCVRNEEYRNKMSESLKQYWKNKKK